METNEERLPASYEYLFALTKPRRVQADAVSLIIIGFLPVASTFLIYSGIQTYLSLRQASTEPSFLYPLILDLLAPAILVAISSYIFWKLRRDRELLRNGELAVGVVTHQKIVEVRRGRGGARKQSRVRYRFKNESGQLFQGTGTDYARRLRVGMTVPVFYYAENPEKNLAICTTTCQLRAD